MSDEPSLPDGWTEVDDERHVVDKYDPRQPATFRSGDVQVFVHPAANSRPEGDTEAWQVDASDRSGGDEGTSDPADSLTAEGRDAALSLAREFMEAYNREGDIDSARRSTADGQGAA
jgi:hypothetical protein